MQTTDNAKFFDVLAGVYGFYGRDLTTFSGTVWLQAMKPFEIDRVTAALSAHLVDPDNGQFLPKPADIVRKLHGTAGDRSLVAWGKVSDAIARVGAWESVAFDDGAIHAAISDMGGWPAVCRTKVDELPFLQKRFTDLYATYSRRQGLIYPSHLIGDTEAINRSNNHRVPEPVLIGDPALAMQVRSGGGQKTQITHKVSSTLKVMQ